ncbi:MAG: nuclear transport factor 2 family protein [Sphingopyxis sp.]|nr:nuclear transport factor 2 family protein [Sphingopyxis sp.]
MTPARQLAELFGDPDAMRALYAPDVNWDISASLGMPPLEGIDAVAAFNEQVWTEHHRRDCSVTILDEVGDASLSAVRFVYRAWSLFAADWYENDYTLFVHAGPAGITRIYEAFDTSATIDFLAGRAPGTGWAAIGGEVGDRVGELGRH